MLDLWKAKSIFEDRVVDGFECTFKVDKTKFYSLNLKDGFFEPAKNLPELAIMKQVVLPELKAKYMKLT